MGDYAWLHGRGKILVLILILCCKVSNQNNKCTLIAPNVLFLGCWMSFLLWLNVHFSFSFWFNILFCKSALLKNGFNMIWTSKYFCSYLNCVRGTHKWNFRKYLSKRPDHVMWSIIFSESVSRIRWEKYAWSDPMFRWVFTNQSFRWVFYKKGIFTVFCGKVIHCRWLYQSTIEITGNVSYVT